MPVKRSSDHNVARAPGPTWTLRMRRRQFAWRPWWCASPSIQPKARKRCHRPAQRQQRRPILLGRRLNRTTASGEQRTRYSDETSA
jgi:hypothetical protein